MRAEKWLLGKIIKTLNICPLKQNKRYLSTTKFPSFVIKTMATNLVAKNNSNVFTYSSEGQI